MSAGKLGGGIGPMDAALIPGRDYPLGGSPDFDHGITRQNGPAINGPAIDIFDTPDYRQSGQLINQPGNNFFGQIIGQPLPQQDNQQYYQQMRKSIDGMNEAFSQIEKMQMPGGQYHGGGQYQGGGGNAGGKTGKGTANF
jgi:hypothetical protein